MAVQYQAPTDDMAFVIRHVIDSQKISQLPGFEEFTDDVIEAVLEEAGKFNAGVISPLNTVGDEDGARPVLLEVIKQGDLGQQAEARELLLRIEAT